MVKRRQNQIKLEESDPRERLLGSSFGASLSFLPGTIYSITTFHTAFLIATFDATNMRNQHYSEEYESLARNAPIVERSYTHHYIARKRYYTEADKVIAIERESRRDHERGSKPSARSIVGLWQGYPVFALSDARIV